MNHLKKLIEIFGVPSDLERGCSETGCSIGGRNSHRILRRGEETGLFVGGQTSRDIISGKQRIGTISVTGRIYASDGRRTNYFVGGETGRKIMYLKRENN